MYKSVFFFVLLIVVNIYTQDRYFSDNFYNVLNNKSEEVASEQHRDRYRRINFLSGLADHLYEAALSDSPNLTNREIQVSLLEAIQKKNIDLARHILATHSDLLKDYPVDIVQHIINNASNWRQAPTYYDCTHLLKLLACYYPLIFTQYKPGDNKTFLHILALRTEYSIIKKSIPFLKQLEALEVKTISGQTLADIIYLTIFDSSIHLIKSHASTAYQKLLEAGATPFKVQVVKVNSTSRRDEVRNNSLKKLHVDLKKRVPGSETKRTLAPVHTTSSTSRLYQSV